MLYLLLLKPKPAMAASILKQKKENYKIEIPMKKCRKTFSIQFQYIEPTIYWRFYSAEKLKNKN